jgi:hypothetical protein
MNRPEIGHDAWTYHQFGAGEFHDQVRALVIHDLDQSVDRDRISPYLRQQATGGPFPFLPIDGKQIALSAEATDAQSVGGVPVLLHFIETQEHSDAFAYLLNRSELLAHLRDLIAGNVTVDFADVLLGVSKSDRAVTVSGPGLQAVDRPSQDREALSLVRSQGVSLDSARRALVEASRGNQAN